MCSFVGGTWNMRVPISQMILCLYRRVSYWDSKDQGLRSLDATLEDNISVPCIHMAVHSSLFFQFQGTWCFSSGLLEHQGHVCLHRKHTCKGCTQSWPLQSPDFIFTAPIIDSLCGHIPRASNCCPALVLYSLGSQCSSPLVSGFPLIW